MPRKRKESRPAEAEPSSQAQGKGRRVNILHRDDAVIVAEKPPLTDVLPGFSDAPSLVEQIEVMADLDDEDFLFPVCPPADEASGLVLIARDEAAHIRLIEQIDNGELEMVHLCLVRGRPIQENGTIEQRLFDNRPGGGLVRVDEENGERALTEWRVLDAFIEFALLECIPRTAIDQQIRPHLSSIGMPLVVDRAYGGGRSLLLSSFKANYRPSRRREERPLIQRLSLHVERLRFRHPTFGASIEFSAERPKDFRAAVHQLERFGRIP